jgi:hypothetical protein
VERITTNVLDRLTAAPVGRAWEPVGHAENLTAMVACENVLFAADLDGVLWTREPAAQNLGWTAAGDAAGVVALASPREAVDGEPIGLYALAAGRLRHRSPRGTAWTDRRAAAGLLALAMSYQSYFAVTATDELVTAPIGDTAGPWQSAGDAGGVTVLTNLNGRLFGAGIDALVTRRPLLDPAAWEPVADLPGPAVALAGYGGRIYLATADGTLYRRDVTG